MGFSFVFFLSTFDYACILHRPLFFLVFFLPFFLFSNSKFNRLLEPNTWSPGCFVSVERQSTWQVKWKISFTKEPRISQKGVFPFINHNWVEFE